MKGMWCMGRSSGKQHCYSLIELLVTIVVVAILAALLLPASRTSQQQANATACVANQRHLALAYAMYSDDWKCTPPVYVNGTRWMSLLASYVDAADGGLEQIFVCPEDRRADDIRLAAGGKERPLSYGINQCYPSRMPADNRKLLLWYGLAASQIRNPSRFIVLADAGSYYIGTTIGIPRTGMLPPDKGGESGIVEGYCQYLVFRHDRVRKVFSAGFADGHVEKLLFDTTPSSYWDYLGKGYGETIR